MCTFLKMDQNYWLLMTIYPALQICVQSVSRIRMSCPPKNHMQLTSKYIGCDIIKAYKLQQSDYLSKNPIHLLHRGIEFNDWV